MSYKRVLICKPGVRVKAFTPALLRMLAVLRDICREDAPWPSEIVITSINDSTHSPGSRHYTNEAMDLRSKNFRREHKPLFREHLAGKLGPQFTVLFEGEGTANEHFHIQPRRGTVYTED